MVWSSRKTMRCCIMPSAVYGDLHATPPEVPGGCGADGWKLRRAHSATPSPLVHRQVLCVLAAVVVAVGVLLALWRRRQSRCLAIVGSASVVATVVAQFAELLNEEPLTMGQFSWYRLSSIFSLTAMGCAAFEGGGAPSGRAQLARWVLAISVLSQHELRPWQFDTVLLPLLVVAAGTVRVGSVRPERAALLIGAISAAVGCRSVLLERLRDARPRRPDEDPLLHYDLGRVVYTHLPVVMGALGLGMHSRSSLGCAAGVVGIVLLVAASVLPPLGGIDASTLRWVRPWDEDPASWCCFAPEGYVGRDVPGGCGTAGLRWTEGRASLGVQWDFRTKVMVPVTVVTNFSGLGGILWSARRGRPFEFVIGVFTMVTSALYHLAESIQSTVMGATDGNWHRLDNVGAILCFVIPPLLFVEATASPQKIEALRWGVFVLTVVLQEIDPWDVAMTLVPIAASLVTLAHTLASNSALRSHAWNSHTKAGLVCLCGAALCFALGLDQNFDDLRLWHGLWHLLAGSGVGLVMHGAYLAGAVALKGSNAI